MRFVFFLGAGCGLLSAGFCSIVRTGKEWYKKSQYNLAVSRRVTAERMTLTPGCAQHDVHLCGYTALLRIVARFHDEVFSDPNSPTGLNKVRSVSLLGWWVQRAVADFVEQQVDFRTVTMTHDAHLDQYNEEWSKRFKEDSDPTGAFLALLSVSCVVLSASQTPVASSDAPCSPCELAFVACSFC